MIVRKGWSAAAHDSEISLTDSHAMFTKVFAEKVQEGGPFSRELWLLSSSWISLPITATTTWKASQLKRISKRIPFNSRMLQFLLILIKILDFYRMGTSPTCLHKTYFTKF